MVLAHECRGGAVGRRLSSGHHMSQASAYSRGRRSARQHSNVYSDSPGEQS